MSKLADLIKASTTKLDLDRPAVLVRASCGRHEQEAVLQVDVMDWLAEAKARKCKTNGCWMVHGWSCEIITLTAGELTKHVKAKESIQ